MKELELGKKGKGKEKQKAAKNVFIAKWQGLKPSISDLDF